MPDQNFIDKQAALISAKTGQLKEEVVEALIEITKGLNNLEVIEALDNLNIEQVMAVKSTGIIASFEAGIAEMLQTKQLFSPMTEETLQALLNSAANIVAAEIGTLGNAIKSEVTTGIISNLTPDQIVENVAAKGYGSSTSIKRVVNDTMNNYSRSVTRVMMDDAPPGTKYVYTGPVDEKTRSYCLELSAAGKLTLEQIVDNGWEPSLTIGGGVNCRHQWDIASTDVRSQFDRGDEVKERLENA